MTEVHGITIHRDYLDLRAATAMSETKQYIITRSIPIHPASSLVLEVHKYQDLCSAVLNETVLALYEKAIIELEAFLVNLRQEKKEVEHEQASIPHFDYAGIDPTETAGRLLQEYVSRRS